MRELGGARESADHNGIEASVAHELLGRRERSSVVARDWDRHAFSRPVRFPLKDAIAKSVEGAYDKRAGEIFGRGETDPGLLRLCGNRAIPCRYSIADVNEELASECASVALPEFRIGAVRHSQEHDITERNCLVHGAYPRQGPKLFDEALRLFGVTR